MAPERGLEGLMGDLTPNFSMREFRCAHWLLGPDEDLLVRLAANLQVIRDALGAPVVVVSGYRCPDCNRACGGARNSRHMVGDAADFRSPGWDVEDLARVVLALIREGRISEGGVGVYWRGRKTQLEPFLHYDCRGTPARWRQMRR